MKPRKGGLSKKSKHTEELLNQIGKWLLDVGKMCLVEEENKLMSNPEMAPEDSISKITTITSSARRRAKAEQVALVQCMTALGEKHALEAQEDILRMEQDKLNRKKE